jgi:hypothetical protein
MKYGIYPQITQISADSFSFVILSYRPLSEKRAAKSGACDVAYLGARPEAFVTSAGAFEAPARPARVAPTFGS